MGLGQSAHGAMERNILRDYSVEVILLHLEADMAGLRHGL